MIRFILAQLILKDNYIKFQLYYFTDEETEKQSKVINLPKITQH